MEHWSFLSKSGKLIVWQIWDHFSPNVLIMTWHLGLKKSHCGVDRSIATHFIPENHHWFTLPFSFSLFFSPSSYSSCYSSPYSVISPPSSLSIQAHLPHTKETVIIPPKRDQYLLFSSFLCLFTLSFSLPVSIGPPLLPTPIGRTPSQALHRQAV